MDFLKKFDAVEICADDRITEADRKFCQEQQAIYQDAVEGFYQIAKVWMDMCSRQKNALSDPQSYDRTWKQKYLVSGWWPDMTVKSIIKHILRLHSTFIDTIVSYLNTTYHLSLGNYEVERELLPEEPDFIETEDAVDWSAFPPAVLRYEDMIDLILAGFNGRTFAEQGPYEMLEGCRHMGWDESTHTANYELKKSTVKFLHGACDYGYYHRHEQWHIEDRMKNVLKGLAHFETGELGKYPGEIEELLSDRSYLWYDLYEFSDGKKLDRVKLFKNGRMDIRFTNESYARQFVSEYLGASK